MISRAIANNGLPLKIQTEWTDNDYWERKYEDSDELKCINVADDGLDWTYRYTSPNTEEGRQEAIKRALSEARLTIW